MKRALTVITSLLYIPAAHGCLLPSFTFLGVASALYHYFEGEDSDREKLWQRADELGMYFVLLSLIAYFSGQPLAMQIVFVAILTLYFAINLTKLDSFVIVPSLFLIVALLCGVGWYLVVFTFAALVRLLWDNHLTHALLWHTPVAIGFYLMLH